jgi:sugar/nucleoside kinase (ribokinase family)
VGEDFTDSDLSALATRGTGLQDVERVAGGATFTWSGEYGWDLNSRRTLATELSVFAEFEPRLSEASRSSEALFLANIHPQLQLRVLELCGDPRFVALDSMNLWIETERDALIEVIERVDCVIFNDAELRQLTGEANIVSAARELLACGPTAVVAKQGEYGAALVTQDAFFALPAYPLENVIDPTGAGDSFAGGFVGYVARHLEAPITDNVLRRAMAHGTALASFNVEEFGTGRMIPLGADDIQERVRELSQITQFEHAPIELLSC